MKNRKLLAILFFICSIFPEAKSDTNYFFNYDGANSKVEIYRTVASSNSQTIQKITTATYTIPEASGAWFDESQNKLYFKCRCQIYL